MTTNEAAERRRTRLLANLPSDYHPLLDEALAAAKAEGAREAALVEQGKDGWWGPSEKGARVLNAAAKEAAGGGRWQEALIHALVAEEAAR